jgi:hypothetical protein
MVHVSETGRGRPRAGPYSPTRLEEGVFPEARIQHGE